MSGKKRLMWLGVLFVAGVGAAMDVGHYTPGPPPDIGDIQSECVEEVPAPRDRTTVGIGEEVRCWIDTKTWRDTDMGTDAEGNQTEMADTLGMVVWAVEGIGTVYPIVTDGSATTMTADLGGEDDTATVIATAYGHQSNVADTMGQVVWSVTGPATIYPTVTDQSERTNLIIDLADEDGVVTITAQVWDSQTLGLDPPVQKQKAMNAKIPTSITIGTTVESPDPNWVKGNANLGASSQFYYQIQPNKENFNQVSFRS